MWTNYLHVLARRAVIMPTGEKRIIARLVATIGVHDDSSQRELFGGQHQESNLHAALQRAAVMVQTRVSENELAGIAIFRVTEDTPPWVECIGRRRRDNVCENCGRERCGGRP